MVEQKVKEILAEQLGVDVNKVTLETNVATDLGADSLDLVEILMSLEDEFGVSIPDEEIALVKMVADEVVPKAKDLLANAEDVISNIQSGCSTEVACDKISFNLKTSDVDKSKYLLELNKLKINIDDSKFKK